MQKNKEFPVKINTMKNLIPTGLENSLIRAKSNATREENERNKPQLTKNVVLKSNLYVFKNQLISL